MKIKTKIFAILIFIFTTSLAYGATETIEMHNKLGKEIMVYSKKVININVGDTIVWKATSKGHNVEFIKGGVPEGVQADDARRGLRNGNDASTYMSASSSFSSDQFRTTRVRGAAWPTLPAMSGMPLELACRRMQARCRCAATMSARLKGQRWRFTWRELRSPYMYIIARWECPTTLTANARRASLGSWPIAFATWGKRRSAWVSAETVTFKTGVIVRGVVSMHATRMVSG
mgnify:CR=1 FL=1